MDFKEGTMKTWVIGSELLMCFAALTGCCKLIEVGRFSLCHEVGRSVGASTDANGNRCETYELRDKTYRTVCDKSSPSYQNPSAQPYPNN